MVLRVELFAGGRIARLRIGPPWRRAHGARVRGALVVGVGYLRLTVYTRRVFWNEP